MKETVLTTVSGRHVDYLRPANIHLPDIALSLAQMPRWVGQTHMPFSVAQHSLLVASMVPEELRIYALIHDAQEALMCDIPTPLKAAMRELGSDAYDMLEDRMYAAICRSLGLSLLQSSAIHAADGLAKKIELAALREGKRPRPEMAAIMALPAGGRDAWLSAVREARRERQAA